MKELLATTLFGLEQVLAAELKQIGAGETRVHNRAVSFKGDVAMMYRANYHLRTALRILKPLSSFPALTESDIYKNIRKMEWERYISNRDLIAVETVMLSKIYKHSGYISQKVKDGIVDRFREKTGRRPSVDLRDPDVRINIHLTDTHCSVSLDSSGESLHKRGYRTKPWKAPLNEVLAAGMIGMSGWKPGQAFLNPMCGSSTLAIEAGMITRALPGGYFRNGFGFQKWGDYDPSLFESVRRERYMEPVEDTGILASDISFDAVRASQDNLASSGFLGKIRLEKAAFESWDPGVNEGVIIMNPPYGERLEEKDLVGLYQDIGNTLKRRYAGFHAWILSGNPGVLKYVGLRPSDKVNLFNGPLKCKFQKYELYDGSRKNVNNTRGQN